MTTTKSTRSTRARILDAAEHLLRTVGLPRTTTKEIARAAGCSEAALYKHFTGKEEIFVAVLWERLPRLNPLLDELNAAVGTRPLAENLTEIAEHAAHFYEQTFPIAGALYAEPAVKQRHIDGVRELGAGPRLPLDALARYLRAEQQLGRIGADADPDAGAALLLGACSQRALLTDFATEDQPPQPVPEFAAALVRTLLRGLR